MKLSVKDAIHQCTVKHFSGIGASRRKRSSGRTPRLTPGDARLALLRDQMIASGELLREALSLEFETRRLNQTASDIPLEEWKEYRTKVEDCAARYSLAVAEWRRAIMDEAQSALLPTPSSEMGTVDLRPCYR